MRVDLSSYDNSWYRPGRGILVRTLWYLISVIFLESGLFPFSRMKVALLRLFGAKVGKAVVIKTRVQVKYPWRLNVGDHVWIGEGVWIDNLADIAIGSHVCLSQGAYLLTGNHDYKDPSFGLMTKGITLDDGVWVGARGVVCPGVHMAEGAILTVGSVLSDDAEADVILSGNPAVKLRERKVT